MNFKIGDVIYDQIEDRIGLVILNPFPWVSATAIRWKDRWSTHIIHSNPASLVFERDRHPEFVKVGKL